MSTVRVVVFPLAMVLSGACGKSTSHGPPALGGSGGRLAEGGTTAAGSSAEKNESGNAGLPSAGAASGGSSGCDGSTDTEACLGADGDDCESDEECLSASCVDGRCCTESCETCEACLGPNGTCVPVGLREPDTEPQGTCDDRNWCDGLGRCEPKAQVVAGQNQTCALLEDGSVRCWGSGNLLGAEPVGDDEAPASVAPLALGGTVAELAAGRGFTCALLLGGTVRCWGYDNGFGKLGYGFVEQVAPGDAPDLDLPETVLHVTAGRHHACALMASGNVRCWGNDAGSDLTPAEESDVAIGDKVLQLSAGEHHTCAILQDHNARWWGVDPLAGHDSMVVSDFEMVSADAIEVAAGYWQTCVLIAGGSVRCWGNPPDAAPLGYGNTATVLNVAGAPDIPLGGVATRIVAGDEHTCALLTGGKVRCWGNGADGRLGYGNTEAVGDDETPADAGDVDVGGEVLELTAGGAHTCALLANDAIRCWGANEAGQLGYGHTEPIGDNETPSEAGDVPYR